MRKYGWMMGRCLRYSSSGIGWDRADLVYELKAVWEEEKLADRCLQKPLKSSSSAIHLLARLQRTRSFWRPPYKDSDRKTLMKTSFQRFFLPESSHG